MTRISAILAAAATAALPAFAMAQDTIQVAMIPKLVGIDYFAATEEGAVQAAEELGNIELIHRGPTTASVNDQIQLIENFTTAGVDVIAVAANDPEAIAPSLQAAMDQGVKVVTFDADADARHLFVNQTTFEGFGQALIDETVRQVGEDAKIAIVTSSLTAPNQNAWIDAMEAHMEANYPELEVLDIRPSEESQELAFNVTQDLLRVYPEMEAVIGLSSVAFPGAAEAVKQADKAGEVAVIGASTPKQMKPFMDDGVIESVVLWNPVDLGYLAIYAAKAAVEQDLAPGDVIDAGKLGEREVREDDTSLWVLLDDPFIFTPENIGDFDF